MAEIKRNKFSYDRSYYENGRRVPVEGTSAKAYDVKEEIVEDFFEDPDLFSEEYTEVDFESTSPKKIRHERERVEVVPGVKKKEKVKRKYKFSLFSILTLAGLLIFLVGACYRYIEVRAELIQADKKVAAAKNELKDIQNINASLRNQLDVETDRNYIYTIAVSKLNMVYPKEADTIYYEKPNEGYVRQYQEIPAVK